MKKIYAVITFSLLLNYGNAQGPGFEWAKVEGKFAYDYGYGIASDNAGNVYIAGKYEENAIFSGNVLPNNGNHDIFVAQYSPQGNLNWIHTAGGYDGDYAHCITTNKISRVYIAGEIEGASAAITFPGSTVTLYPKGNNDLFIAVYDLGGNLQWAKRDGDICNEKALGIATDNSGNIIVSGYFMDTTKFDSGPAVISKGDRDMLVAKYDANGNFLWMKHAGGPGKEEGKGVVCDSSGNIYVTGLYEDGAVFGSTTYTVQNTPWGKFSNGYVAKYDPNGNLLWVNSIGEEYLDAAWGITIDNTGKIYVTGEFTSGKFIGSNIYWSGGREDMFVACYDKNGICEWVNHGGGPIMDRGRGVGVDGSTILVTGQFGLSGTFSSVNVNAADSEDIFVAAYDNTGNFLWVRTVGGVADSFEDDGYESGNAICGNSGSVYVTGALLNDGIFESKTLNCYTRTDVFIAKLSSAGGIGVNEITSADQFIHLNPNPARDKLNVFLNQPVKNGKFIIYHGIGRAILEERIDGEKIFDLSAFASGLYTYRLLENNQQMQSGRIVIE